jgi:hypothetical protein
MYSSAFIWWKGGPVILMTPGEANAEGYHQAHYLPTLNTEIFCPQDTQGI